MTLITWACPKLPRTTAWRWSNTRYSHHNFPFWFLFRFIIDLPMEMMDNSETAKAPEAWTWTCSQYVYLSYVSLKENRFLVGKNRKKKQMWYWLYPANFRVQMCLPRTSSPSTKRAARARWRFRPLLVTWQRRSTVLHHFSQGRKKNFHKRPRQQQLESSSEWTL